jgi:hypothetical protein
MPAAAHPESSFFNTFYTDYLPRALYFDSKKSSHPLSIDPGGCAGLGRIDRWLQVLRGTDPQGHWLGCACMALHLHG